MYWCDARRWLVRGRIGFLTKEMYGNQTSLLAQVRVEFPDGSMRLIGTGPEWKATLEGPDREMTSWTVRCTTRDAR